MLLANPSPNNHPGAFRRVGFVKYVVVVGIVLSLVAVLSFTKLGSLFTRVATLEVTDAEETADNFFDQLSAGQLESAYQSTSADYRRESRSRNFASGFPGVQFPPAAAPETTSEF